MWRACVGRAAIDVSVNLGWLDQAESEGLKNNKPMMANNALSRSAPSHEA
jgi:hypothetical protein